ncbi:MAG: hypothetical protein DIZ80_16900 [endosymbiont of Galathealinum brachiosum]|uniref:Uncharacterized protein n=1 Tax=endosymbiont of Galathealinum brachiosum TaxID=2200906 RepID=A0A370D6R1_9GAMM|nr:MAG: hypothetical protein DIZ80_16900 [endosymbiont of Galathealinum brachiosum]
MWNQIRGLEEKIKHRKTLKIYSRCGFYYSKTETSCPHCADMDDETVLRQLARKKHFRLSLGKGMFIAAILILLLMIII